MHIPTSTISTRVEQKIPVGQCSTSGDCSGILKIIVEKNPAFVRLITHFIALKALFLRTTFEGEEEDNVLRSFRSYSLRIPLRIALLMIRNKVGDNSRSNYQF